MLDLVAIRQDAHGARSLIDAGSSAGILVFESSWVGPDVDPVAPTPSKATAG